jgi:hypothetical protein
MQSLHGENEVPFRVSSFVIIRTVFPAALATIASTAAVTRV